MSGSNDYSLAMASLGYTPSGNNVSVSGSSNAQSSTNEGGGISISPGSLAASIVNAISQGITNKRNREFASEQARLQNQWNIEQWNRENAYNTPAAQMQRYIDAGLNPNLIVGQQNLAASSPQLVSGKDAPAGVAPQLPVDLPLQAAQIRNLDAQSNLANEQAKVPEQQVELIKSQLDLTKEQSKQVRAAIEVTWLSVQEMQSRIDLNKVSFERKGLENTLFRENFNSARAAAAARNWIDIQKASTFYKIQDLAIKEAKARINSANANASYYSALKKQVESLTPEMRDYYEQLATYYQKLSDKTVSETEYQNLMINTYKLFGVKQAEAEYERTQRQDRTWYFNLFYDLNQSLMSPIDGFQEWLYGNLNPGTGASGRW